MKTRYRNLTVPSSRQLVVMGVWEAPRTYRFGFKILTLHSLQSDVGFFCMRVYMYEYIIINLASLRVSDPDAGIPT